MVSLGRRRSGCRGLVGKCEKRDHLKELNLDGRITKWIFRKEKGGRSWIFLAQVRQNWRAPTNASMDIRLP